MCRSSGEGGRRCEYADLLSTVRRQARRKHGDDRRAVEQAVTKWKRQNTELVETHLPASAPFTVVDRAPGRIPLEFRGQLSSHARTPIRGGTNQGQLTEAMFAEHEAWMAELSDDLAGAVGQYTFVGFETLNGVLRGNYRDMNDRHRRRGTSAESRAEERTRALELRDRLDAAFALASRTHDEPRRLYRFMNLPEGVTAKTYLSKYLQPGSDFADPGYMSTTEDPDFITAHINSRLRRDRGLRYIAFEMITPEGVSFQQRGRTQPGNVQSLEHERVLPRGTKFRVAGVRERQQWQVSEGREDLTNHFRIFRDGSLDMAPPRLVIPTVQLVDTQLLKP